MAKRPAPPVSRGIMSDSNESAFWHEFKKGYMKYFWMGLAIALGIQLGNYVHPYEQCKRVYDTAEEVTECIRTKENS